MTLHPADELRRVHLISGEDYTAYLFIPYGEERVVALIVKLDRGRWYCYAPKARYGIVRNATPYGGPYKTRREAAAVAIANHRGARAPLA